jgi:amino-acid N-acetyltransferase
LLQLASPEYSPASPRDAEAIGRLLAESGLPSDDIGPHLADFVVARVDGGLIGVAGMEVLGDAGLLRSVAVRADHRCSGVARALCEKVLAQARLRGVAKVYLLTTTAAGYFRQRFGFTPVERASAPKTIQGTHEFSHACPQTAALLVRAL